MNKEEKTMGRVLNELKKCHPQILSSAVRNGRVFQYKYYLKDIVESPATKAITTKPSKLKKRESKEEEKTMTAAPLLMKGESESRTSIHL